MSPALVIAGAAGRMGRALIEAAAAAGARIAFGLERADHPQRAADCGELAGIGRLDAPIRTDFDGSAAEFDVLIDFTRPDATLAHLARCAELRRAMVIGTTGIDAAGQEKIRSAATIIPIVYAPNMSVGVNLCLKLVELVAQTWGSEADIEIIEAHHRNKIDAPSGTALALGRAAARGLGRELDDEIAIYTRHGHTGERPRPAIGFATIRAGSIVGDHSVMFATEGERIEITHRAESRLNFARGAIRAALWLHGKPPGLYDMQDVLGLRDFAKT